MSTDTRRLRVVVTGDSGDAQQAVEAVGDSAQQTGGKLQRLAGLLASFAARGAVALGVLATAGAAMGIKTAMQLEQVEVGFTTMLGSADKAKKFMKQLADFAAATPFEFPELVGSAQRFLAMGFAAKDIIPMLTAVGDAVAAMGGSAESVDAVTRALGQMSAKGKVSGEELMQLTEQGIPALQILADAYGVSTGQLSKMIEKGQVASDRAIPALIKGLREGTKNVEGFGGMMEKQSETMAGKWSTLMDNLQTGLGNFVRNFEPQIKGAMDAAGAIIGGFFAGLEGKGELEGFAGKINTFARGLRGLFKSMKDGKVTSDGFVGAMETAGSKIRDAAKAVKEFITGFKGGAGLDGTVSSYEKLGEKAKALVNALGDLADLTAEVVRWFREHESVTKTLTTAIGILTVVTVAHALAMKYEAAGGLAGIVKNLGLWAKNTKLVSGATKVAAAAQWAWNLAMSLSPMGLVILGIALLIGAIVLLWKKSETFRDIVIGVWNAIKTAAGAVADWFMNHVWPLLKSVWEGIAGGFSAAAKGISAAFGAVADWFMTHVWPILRTIFDNIAASLKFLYNVIWKPIWILIQIAVKIFVWYFQNFVLPGLRLAFDWIAKGLGWLGDKFSVIWGWIKRAAGAAAEWFMNVVWPKLKVAFDSIKNALGWLGEKAAAIWGAIRRAAQAVADWFMDKIMPKIRSALTRIKESFDFARDKIGEAWGKLKDIAKKPVEFIVNTVYNRGIRRFWNTVAEKFGIKTRLDEMKFAKGGVVPGYGPRKDRVRALLSPGEGVAVPELIRQIGVNRFLDWNKKAREGKPVAFADGGIVGWGKSLLSKGKDIVQGIAAPVVKPLIDGLRRVLNQIPGLPGNGLSGMLRTGGNRLLDAAYSWVAGKDKQAGGGGAGKVSGYQNMMRMLRARFPGLALISGYRPGSRTLTGNLSYHALGRAVDLPPRKDVFEWIRSTFFRNIKELIFSPMGFRQVWNGANHMYHEPVRGQHWDHVHWAMDNGGRLPPNSTTVVRNATNSDEYALPEPKLKRLLREAGGTPVIIEGDVTIQVGSMSDARKLRDEIIKFANRNGGRAGLPKTP